MRNAVHVQTGSDLHGGVLARLDVLGTVFSGIDKAVRVLENEDRFRRVFFVRFFSLASRRVAALLLSDVTDRSRHGLARELWILGF